MIRQDSTSTGSVRSTHVSNNFINQIGSRIRQRLATANRRSMFMFTDYSPKHFAKMREVSGIANEDYLESFKSTTMPSFSEGRSGAFLYFSSDRKYIVKTTTKTEFDKLLQILPQYVEYFVDQISQGHKPLITRFLGAHKIIMYDIPLYFVIMQNICPSVQEKYDLKGSWVNRHSSKKKDYNPKDSRPKKFNIVSGDSHRALNRRQDGAQLFLDNDLQNCFLLDPKVSKYLAEQILRDIKLLAGKFVHWVSDFI
jgi:1-phosphatidylinositol-4-phosphate 5-kinase